MAANLQQKPFVTPDVLRLVCKYAMVDLGLNFSDHCAICLSVILEYVFINDKSPFIPSNAAKMVASHRPSYV